MTKVCTKCGAEKELDHFNIRRRKNCNDSSDSYCRECRKQLKREHYSRYRTQIKEERREYYEQNADHIKDNWRKRSRSQLGWITIKWNSLNARTINGSHPLLNHKRHKSYFAHGVRLEMTREEFATFVKSHWDVVLAIRATGGIPSIDRIDSSGHYSVGNIRIISMKENAKLGSVSAHKKDLESKPIGNDQVNK